ncbi:tRNA (guanosine(37)-N1)-methyltransferase TrmD [Candidatus Acetothermia bacterium]|nr:tRNA (guanosine(37)-N1)-methyltransferase TrmD [Candidatus Acetothermia bacterium]MBI3643071.1 tRNA (guanosine(37)-N1)-methyltransferase TrmD [Candidatus Acetothermia bacterium]
MRVDIVTLFPEIIEPYFQSGLISTAIGNGLIEIYFHQLRDFTFDKHRQVDDRPFGGGPGMVLKPEPFFRAIEHIRDLAEGKPRVILLSARGKLLHQAYARDLSTSNWLILLCGRYQEMDERIYTLANDEISIGDYVLSGGELPGLVVTEAICRLIPGVLGNSESIDADSFAKENLLGPPQYTRPPDFEGMKVPEVLLSGHHAEIERWRLMKALEKTRENRPDLLDKGS